jgi:hypothetical protein
MAFFEDGPAMSHNEKCGQILGKVLPFLTLHEEYWYRDRHYHKTHATLATCACCRTNRKYGPNRCGLCADAWSLSKVNEIFKQKVYEHGVTFKKWWRVWTPEERKRKALERKSKGKGKRKDKGKGKGYEPHAYHQARAPQPSTTNTDSWASWDTPDPPPPLWSPDPLESWFPPPDPPPPPPLLDLEDQPEKKDEASSSCRKDGSFDQLTSRLAALAVAFDGRKHVPAEDEKSCHNDEDYEQTTSRQAVIEAACIEENGPEEEHAFEESGPKEEHDFDAMD